MSTTANAGAGPVTDKEAHTTEATKPWTLRLSVAGQTPKSLAAFANLQAICQDHLRGQYQIEVVDLLEKPELAQDDQVLAIPTVVRRLPLPMRKIIGDLSDTQRAILALVPELGLSIIAEGVETGPQRQFLARNGCRAFQGYLFGRPEALDALLAVLGTTSSPPCLAS